MIAQRERYMSHDGVAEDERVYGRLDDARQHRSEHLQARDVVAQSRGQRAHHSAHVR